jgi:hypothetical protein
VLSLNEEINIDKLEKELIKDTMVDGLTEIFMGVIFLLMPIVLQNPIFVVFYAFVPLVSRFLLDTVRYRTTYPRIGRIELKEEVDIHVRKSLTELLMLLTFALILTGMSMVIVEGRILEIENWYKWVPMLFGLIMFGPSIYLAEKTGQKNYYLLGIVATLLGVGFSITDFPTSKDGMYLYFYALGVISVLFGILRFIVFMRRYPIITDHEDEP